MQKMLVRNILFIYVQMIAAVMILLLIAYIYGLS